MSKVPAATPGFWIIKILATTLGETGGDTLSMTWELGYLVSTFIFVVPLGLLVAARIRAQGFHPMLYWATITLSQTLGATVGDFLDKPIAEGGLSLSWPLASLVPIAAIAVLVLVLPQGVPSGA